MRERRNGVRELLSWREHRAITVHRVRLRPRAHTHMHTYSNLWSKNAHNTQAMNSLCYTHTIISSERAYFTVIYAFWSHTSKKMAQSKQEWLRSNIFILLSFHFSFIIYFLGAMNDNITYFPVTQQKLAIMSSCIRKTLLHLLCTSVWMVRVISQNWCPMFLSYFCSKKLSQNESSQKTSTQSQLCLQSFLPIFFFKFAAHVPLSNEGTTD